MFQMMRKVFGPVAVSFIIGSIALVFVFYGVFNPRGSSGVSSGAMAAQVNGDNVTMQEFSREYQSRIDMYQNMMKGKMDPALFQRLGLQRQVLEDLVRRKLMLQEAKRAGMRVSDEELRDKIQEMPYFQKDGRFDASQYNQVLTANHMSPSVFEDMVREDVLRTQFIELLRGRAKVSEAEVEREFVVAQDQRQVDYVAVGSEQVKKLLVVSDKEVDDFLKSEDGVKAAKQHYEQTRFQYEKPAGKKDLKAKADPKKGPEYLPFEDVKQRVVSDLLKERKVEEGSKLARELATEILNKWKTASDAEMKAFAKAKGLELKTTEKFSRLSGAIPGVGEAPELVNDAFKGNSELEKSPKQYEARGVLIVAKNLKALKPNLSDLSKDREKLITQATTRKEQAIFEQWMGEARSKAKVTMNESLLKGNTEETAVE